MDSEPIIPYQKKPIQFLVSSNLSLDSEPKRNKAKKKRGKTMAKLITRTFIENLATVKVVSTITDEVTTIKVIIPVSKNTVEKAERFLNKNLIYDEYKCISVLELTAEETLRGITEEQFLDLSVILDKETRKPIELVDENIMPLPERE